MMQKRIEFHGRGQTCPVRDPIRMMRNILERKRKKEKEKRDRQNVYLLCSVIHSLEGVSHIQGLIGGGSQADRYFSTCTYNTGQLDCLVY